MRLRRRGHFPLSAHGLRRFRTAGHICCAEQKAEADWPQPQRWNTGQQGDQKRAPHGADGHHLDASGHRPAFTPCRQRGTEARMPDKPGFEFGRRSGETPRRQDKENSSRPARHDHANDTDASQQQTGQEEKGAQPVMTGGWRRGHGQPGSLKRHSTGLLGVNATRGHIPRNQTSRAYDES